MMVISRAFELLIFSHQHNIYYQIESIQLIAAQLWVKCGVRLFDLRKQGIKTNELVWRLLPKSQTILRSLFQWLSTSNPPPKDKKLLQTPSQATINYSKRLLETSPVKCKALRLPGPPGQTGVVPAKVLRPIKNELIYLHN